MDGQRCIICKSAWYQRKGRWECQHTSGCPSFYKGLNGLQVERGLIDVRQFPPPRDDLRVTPWVQSTPCCCHHAPSHAIDCTGRNGVVLNPLDQYGVALINAYYEQLDEIVDHLIDEKPLSVAETARLKGQAEAYAWCIAKMQNQVKPNVNGVRAEVMRRREARKTKANGKVAA